MRRSAIRLSLALVVLPLLATCRDTTTAPLAIRPTPWVDNVWTQPVPAWGSPVRLNLPVPLASIDLTGGGAGGIGGFGAHEGGHVGV